jgi:DNA repair exonuclease SbcCD ATPase subunit
MKNQELQPNISNLQTLEAEVSLTKQELDDFRKLPKNEQEKLKKDKLAKLSDLQNKLDQAIQEAIKTGNLEEAKKLKEQIEREIQDLEEQIDITESMLFEEKFEVIPDPEITSVETAIDKFKAEGYDVDEFTEAVLEKINWSEKLEDSYTIVSISIRKLFRDKKKHTYAEIKNKAKENGLDLVPMALTPSIRLNYKKAQTRIIATEVFSVFNEHDIDNDILSICCCYEDNNSSLLLGVDDGHGKLEWSDEDCFFFVRE